MDSSYSYHVYNNLTNSTTSFKFCAYLNWFMSMLTFSIHIEQTVSTINHRFLTHWCADLRHRFSAYALMNIYEDVRKTHESKHR